MTANDFKPCLLWLTDLALIPMTQSAAENKRQTIIFYLQKSGTKSADLGTNHLALVLKTIFRVLSAYYSTCGLLKFQGIKTHSLLHIPSLLRIAPRSYPHIATLADSRTGFVRHMGLNKS